MVQILPFAGWRYHPNLPLSMVTAPPFDAIDRQCQQRLHQRHPNNAVRLSRPWQNNPAIAAAQLAEWRKKGVLQQDPLPGIYAYQHQWMDHKGTQQLRQGMIALVHLDGPIIPHEETLYGPIQDRLAMLEATQTQTCPLFLLYRDHHSRINRRLIESVPDSLPWITDDDGVNHRLWPVQDVSLIAFIQHALAERRLLIADGHHRFETLTHFRTIDPQHPPYALAYLANMADPAMTVQPINRGFTLPITELRHAFFRAFHPIPFPENQAFTVYTRKWDMHFRLNSDLGSGIPIVQLEKLIFEAMLNTTTLALKQAGLLKFYPLPEYPDPKALLKSEGLSSVVYVRPPDLITVLDRCQQGMRLPLKSTYFYPKPLSGLVFYSQ